MKKRYLIYSILPVVLIIILSIIILALRPKKTVHNTVAFYNIQQTTKSAILAQLDPKYSYIELDSSIPFSAQTQKLSECSLVFAQLDYDIIDLAKNSNVIQMLPKNLLSGMPYSVADSVTIKNGGAMYVPLLTDFYQIDINTASFENWLNSYNGEKEGIEYWSDFAQYIGKQKNEYSVPLIFSGKDNKRFLGVVGMLAEAAIGPDEYNTLCKNLYRAFKNDYPTGEFNNLMQVLDTEFSTDGRLHKPMMLLYSFMKDGILTKDSLRLIPQDVDFYLENKISASAFLTLSDHRQIDRKFANNLSSIYCPTNIADSKRKFSAPMVCVFALEDSDELKNEIKKFATDAQYELSAKSGLAPVQKNCPVPDHQADDVRYWIAASVGANCPLYSAVPSAKAEQLCADYLRNFLIPR